MKLRSSNSAEVRSRARVALPPEMTALIADELDLILLEDNDPNLRYETGLACCLASRALLPLGRTILYRRFEPTCTIGHDLTGARKTAKLLQHHDTLLHHVDIVGIQTMGYFKEAFFKSVAKTLERRSEIPTFFELHLHQQSLFQEQPFDTVDMSFECWRNSISAFDEVLQSVITLPLKFISPPICKLSIRNFLTSKYHTIFQLVERTASQLRHLDLSHISHCPDQQCTTSCPSLSHLSFPQLEELLVFNVGEPLVLAILNTAPKLRKFRYGLLDPIEQGGTFPTLDQTYPSVHTLEIFVTPPSQAFALSLPQDSTVLLDHYPALNKFVLAFPSTRHLVFSDNDISGYVRNQATRNSIYPYGSYIISHTSSFFPQSDSHRH
ncbi:hypothetical protein T439DRAFT_348936 [Meredithblackwellia eburnea MCA 4105]